jgi:hypothetical protein
LLIALKEEIGGESRPKGRVTLGITLLSTENFCNLKREQDLQMGFRVMFFYLPGLHS